MTQWLCSPSSIISTKKGQSDFFTNNEISEKSQENNLIYNMITKNELFVNKLTWV